MNHHDSNPPSAGDTPPTSYTPSLSSSLSNLWSSLARSFSGDMNTGLPDHRSSNKRSLSDASSSLYDLPPLSPVTLSGYKARVRPEFRLLSHAMAEEIRNLLPERLKLVDEWKLVYSLVQDGASLSTMYNRTKAYKESRAGFVLVVRDGAGATFGAYLSEAPHPAPSYFGNGECFLWRASLVSNIEAHLPPPPSADTTYLSGRSTTLLAHDDDASSTRSGTSTSTPPVDLLTGQPMDLQDGPFKGASNGTSKIEKSVRFKAYPYSGLNDYFMNCEATFFSIGAGGGHYGLWLDAGLEHGHSARCETFGNEPLSEEGEKFYIINTEMWVIGGGS